MFKILHVADWGGVGGSPTWMFAPDGMAAVRERERLGLPVSPNGMVNVVVEEVSHRAAAESWPDALDNKADLPMVSIGYDRQVKGKECEFADMVAAGILVSDGPVKVDNVLSNVGLRFKLSVSPHELVAWRRAWAAEQECVSLRKQLMAATAMLQALPAEEE